MGFIFIFSTVTTQELIAPTEFAEALLTLRDAHVPEGFTVEEVPGPSKSAPYTAAIRITGTSVGTPDLSAGTANHPSRRMQAKESFGRFVILYDPAGQRGWNGTFRLIVLVHADIEPDIAEDQFSGEVAWSWLGDALVKAGAGYHDVAGTVTRVLNQQFGTMRSDDLRVGASDAQIELRASWTPNTTDLRPHFEAVCELLEFVSLGHSK